jgi:pentatricopeptide repeat protein
LDFVVDKDERPSVIMFITLIARYCLAGKMEKAFGVLDVMVSFGIEPDVVTYAWLINGYVKMEELMLV